MDKYEAVRDQIQRARIERSVYLAEILADMMVSSWNGIKLVAESVLGHARAKPAKRLSVFTFDA